MDCYRLETMFHLEIQKGKETMKTSNFQKIRRNCSANEENNDGYKRVCTIEV